MIEETVIVPYETVSLPLQGGPQKNSHKFISGKPVIGPNLETGTSLIRIRDANKSTTMLDICMRLHNNIKFKQTKLTGNILMHSVQIMSVRAA